MFEERITRRDALKKAAYMTPVILTFLAAPSFSSGGSGRDDRDEGPQESIRYESGEKDQQYAVDLGGSGTGKRGFRWLWDHERDERRRRKKHWTWE